MELRPTRYDHPDAIALTESTQRYYVEIYGGRDDDPVTAESFAAPSGGFLVGYLGERPVAMGGWLFTSETARAKDAAIRRMFVDPVVRRHGYARQLLTALEVDAAENGASRMVLTTGLPQAAAVAFYRQAGYADIEPFGYYRGQNGAVHLGKALSS